MRSCNHRPEQMTKICWVRSTLIGRFIDPVRRIITYWLLHKFWKLNPKQDCTMCLTFHALKHELLPSLTVQCCGNWTFSEKWAPPSSTQKSFARTFGWKTFSPSNMLKAVFSDSCFVALESKTHAHYWKKHGNGEKHFIYVCIIGVKRESLTL